MLSSHSRFFEKDFYSQFSLSFALVPDVCAQTGNPCERRLGLHD